MVKKSWGRLGAAVGAVALLTGGLVGVAAPANAGELESTDGLTFCTNVIIYSDENIEDMTGFLKEQCENAKPGYVYRGYWYVSDIVGVSTSYELYGAKLTAEDCLENGQVLNDQGTGCRDLIANDCPDQKLVDGKCVNYTEDDCTEFEELSGDNPPTCIPKKDLGGGIDTESGEKPDLSVSAPPAGYEFTGLLFEPLAGVGCDEYTGDYVEIEGDDGSVWCAEIAALEAEQAFSPPPPCWDASINNCPVGGALRFTAPKYAMVGVPITMYAYASWRPDANAPSQPTNGTAVIRVDGEDYSGVEFVDGVAEWRFIPETEGMKEFTASGVLFSGLSGANAYIDTVPARTYVLEYDPEMYETALKNKRVEVGDTYVITDPNQARSYLEDRYEWSVSEKSDDVCAVYETKKGAVKAKFNGEGKCTVIWMDKESEEEGKYTFIAKKK